MRFAYPRPQLQRTHWISLNGPWRFSWDPSGRFEHPSDIDRWPLAIEVPFPPESAASGIGDRRFHPVCWYQRSFRVDPAGGRVILHFGAVDYLARVWVNDWHAVTHEGGHTPFCADITPALRPSGDQVVTVRVEDDPHDLSKPRGKQDWQEEAHAIWYPRTTGIWQTVWLERVSRTYIANIRWTPHLEGFAIDFESTIFGDSASELSVEVELRHGARVLARDRYGVIDGEANRRIMLSDPGIDDFRNEVLWSPERPTLLDAHVRLRREDVVIDECHSYTALRAVDIVRDRFMLNGRPYFLRMVLDQGYWPDTLLAPPSDDALRRDVELAKAMGFNGVRKHQKIEAPRYLYWADRLGLLVWEEMPSAYRFTHRAIKRTIAEWREAIERDYSHPSVIVWVPFNESWGVPDLASAGRQRNAVQALYHFTKTLDPTRPVVGNDGWESAATDMIGIHDYDDDAEQLKERYGVGITPEQLLDRRRPAGRVLTLDGHPHRGQPIILTECGGIAYYTGDQPQRDKPWGYSVATSGEDWLSRYRRLMEAVVSSRMLTGFCYTQFADTFQEVNGLLRADRRPKMDLEQIRLATCARHTGS